MGRSGRSPPSSLGLEGGRENRQAPNGANREEEGSVGCHTTHCVCPVHLAWGRMRWEMAAQSMAQDTPESANAFTGLEQVRAGDINQEENGACI